jgi:PAS domain S-box-containing protein
MPVATMMHKFSTRVEKQAESCAASWAWVGQVQELADSRSLRHVYLSGLDPGIRITSAEIPIDPAFARRIDAGESWVFQARDMAREGHPLAGHPQIRPTHWCLCVILPGSIGPQAVLTLGFTGEPSPELIAQVESNAEVLGMQLELERQVDKYTETTFQLKAVLHRIPSQITYTAFEDGQVAFSRDDSDSFLGYSPEEWAETPDLFQKLMLPEDLEAFRGQIRESFTTGRAMTIEVRVRSKSGSIHWFRADGYPLPRPDGRIEAVQGVIEDITSAKEAQLGLQARDRRARVLDALTESMRDDLNPKRVLSRTLTVICDLADATAARIFFLEPSDSTLVHAASKGHANHPMFNKQRLPLEGTALGEALRNDSTLILESDASVCDECVVSVPIKVKDRIFGALFLVRPAADPFTPEDIETLTMVGRSLGANISRSRQHRKVQMEAERYRRLFSGGSDAVIVADRNLKLMDVNEAALSLFGCEASALLQRYLPDFPIASDRLKLSEMLQAAAEGKESSAEILLRRPDGAEISVEISATRVYIQDELCYLCVIRDLRTLQQRKLTQAIERYQTMKANFLEHISHELRTPLGHVIGFAQLLSEQHGWSLSAQQRRYLDAILTNARWMLNLTDNLLELTEVEKDTLKLEMSEFNIGELTTALGAVLRHRAQVADITLDLHIPPDMPLVYADKTAVKRIIIEIVDNAIKFNHPGGRVTLTMDWKIDPDGDGMPYYYIVVTDSGMGMTEEQLEQIRFFMPRSPVGAHPQPGLGYGMLLVQHLIGLHGGTMQIDSQLGQGTRVAVKMPLRTEESELWSPLCAAVHCAREKELTVSLIAIQPVITGEGPELQPVLQAQAEIMQQVVRNDKDRVIIDNGKVFVILFKATVENARSVVRRYREVAEPMIADEFGGAVQLLIAEAAYPMDALDASQLRFVIERRIREKLFTMKNRPRSEGQTDDPDAEGNPPSDAGQERIEAS